MDEVIDATRAQNLVCTVEVETLSEALAGDPLRAEVRRPCGGRSRRAENVEHLRAGALDERLKLFQEFCMGGSKGIYEGLFEPFFLQACVEVEDRVDSLLVHQVGDVPEAGPVGDLMV